MPHELPGTVVLSFGQDGHLSMLLQVVYEKAEGVLLSQEVKWRHNVNVSTPALHM